MPRVKLFNEEEVLQKAISLFWEKGYHHTSMQDLVTNLGIHRGSMYDTFGGKKELFIKAFKSYIKDNNTTASDFLNNQNSVKEGLLLFFELPIDASKCDSGNKGCFVVNTTAEMLPTDEGIHELLKTNRIAIEKIFYQYLEKGVNSGEISNNKDIMSISSFLYSLLNGILIIGKINPDKNYLMNIVKTGLSVLD